VATKAINIQNEHIGHDHRIAGTDTGRHDGAYHCQHRVPRGRDGGPGSHQELTGHLDLIHAGRRHPDDQGHIERGA